MAKTYKTIHGFKVGTNINVTNSTSEQILQYGYSYGV